jgi:hypothetical protein
VVLNNLYHHKSLHLKYTTYDMRGDQDKIYQRNFPDVMVLSDDEGHPYMYGRVLNFFHAEVINHSPIAIPLGDSTAMVQMVWIHWFKLDNKPRAPGFHSLRFPSVSFYEGNHQDAFGFLHPDEIIRATHLIPRFKFGRTNRYIDVSSKARPDKEDQDWMHFSVNMYVITVQSHPLI